MTGDLPMETTLALAAMETQTLAAVLPDYLRPAQNGLAFVRVRIPWLDSPRFHHRLAWNPRLLRLNPHAARRRDFLATSLARRMTS